MRWKGSSLIFSIIIFTTIISPYYCKADYNVEVGQIFNYTMSESKVFASAYNETYSTEGFSIYTYKTEVGNPFNVNVTYLGPNTIDYKIIIGTIAWEDFVNSYNDYGRLRNMVIYTPNIAQILVSNWENFSSNFFDSALNIICNLFFLEVLEGSWRTLRNFRSDFITEQSSLWDESLQFSLEDKLSENTEEIMVEWLFKGDYNYLTVFNNFNNYSSEVFTKLSYSKIDGNILGLWIKGTSSGIVRNETFDFSLEQKFEMDGYTLSNFEICATNNSSFNLWSELIGIFCIIVPFNFLLKKRKKIIKD
ncbi:MAG TPA: choice-of-anchor S family protein [candidate division Zixibacteria bacterium]|nr:choice-of-anchor S family protein [candidate division Zixibacteria bacterium]